MKHFLPNYQTSVKLNLETHPVDVQTVMAADTHSRATNSFHGIRFSSFTLLPSVDLVNSLHPEQFIGGPANTVIPSETYTANINI